MDKSTQAPGLFPAIMKYWRGRRGLSQLDLALAADVSSRHVSFLETGRSAPSAEMVLRLASALDVPLRQANAMLRAAGHEPAFREPAAETALPEGARRAVQMMKDRHEPFPLILIDRTYDILDFNAGAAAFFGALTEGLAEQDGARLNLARLTFDPGMTERIVNFDEIGRALLWRLQREALADPDDATMRALVDDVLAMPTVEEGWREIDLAAPTSPTLVVHVRVGGVELRFLTMITMFQAPQVVALDELRIETWFPADEETERACRALVGA